MLALFGHSHTAIAIAQGLLHAAAVFFAAFSLRRQVRTPYLVAAILVGGTFLPHLQFARMLLSESVFTSVSLIALGCLWSARTARRPAAAIAWTCAFGAATAAAVSTRPIGVALLAPLAVTWLSDAVALWKAAPRGARFRAVARWSIPALIAVLIVVGWIGAWSFRNLRARGWFGFAAMASLSDFQGEVLSGTLDPRVLIPFGAVRQARSRERARLLHVERVEHLRRRAPEGRGRLAGRPVGHHRTRGGDLRRALPRITGPAAGRREAPRVREDGVVEPRRLRACTTRPRAAASGTHSGRSERRRTTSARNTPGSTKSRASR